MTLYMMYVGLMFTYGMANWTQTDIQTSSVDWVQKNMPMYALHLQYKAVGMT